MHIVMVVGFGLVSLGVFLLAAMLINKGGRAIDGALERIDEGTYGTCVTCARPIGEDRLAAIPWATQCIDCRRAEERG